VERSPNWPVTILLIALAFAIITTFGAYMKQVNGNDDVVDIVPPAITVPK